MKVTYELVRHIPQWKATLTGQPNSTKEQVEIEIWEHTTRGMEPLAKAFAELKTPFNDVEIKPIRDKTVFFFPPEYREHPLLQNSGFYATTFRLHLPTLGEDDDAQKIADEYFDLVRKVYREGCELAARIVKTLLELPESAWDSPHEVAKQYADKITVRGYDPEKGFKAAASKLELPEGYLKGMAVTEMLKNHQKLREHMEAIRDKRRVEFDKALAIAQKQHDARTAEIEKVHEANRAKFLELFLSTCTDEDRERYDRGFVSEREMRNRVREVLFGDFAGTRYRRMTAREFCDECADVDFSVVEDRSLNAEQFAMLKEVEAFFTAPEFSVKIRKHWGRCDCSTQGQATALVTWQSPGVDPLSREYEIGFAITP